MIKETNPMKIDSYNGGIPWLTDRFTETAKTNQPKATVMPYQTDSFHAGQNFLHTTKALSATQYYNSAKMLSAQGSQSEITDGAWKDYLGAGLLVRDLRHARWVTDLFQGFNLKNAKNLEGIITKIPTPGGSLPIAIPKAAAGTITDVATPAGKLAVATATKGAPLAKIAAKAAPLAKVAAKAGRVLGRAVPVLNVGLAALDVHDAVKIAQDPKASTGKKVLGVATAALSAVSVIPGIGFFAGLGAAALGIARDAVK
jgi:hypothetical protein